MCVNGHSCLFKCLYVIPLCAYVFRAYSRMRYDVLVFCHQHRMVDLTQSSLSLSTSNRPLMIDILRTEKYTLLRDILLSSPGKEQSASVQKLLTKVYEYGCGNLGTWRDSLLSLACRAYMKDNPNMLTSLLSYHTIGCQLSHIKIENVDLDSVPLALFDVKLCILELSNNMLTTLPIAEALSRGLCDSLKVLNIASNSFSICPKELFHMPALTKLDARNNEITALPEDMWTAPCLEELYLCKNRISSLPCPEYLYLEKTVSTPIHSSQSSHQFNSNEIQSERQAYLTAKTPDTETVLRGFRLQVIDLSGNNLCQIPRGLACLAPHLRVLKLNSNHIVDLGHPCNYPQSLQNLDVSKNMCERCIKWCPDPPNVACAQSQLQQENRSCTHVNHVVLSSLKFLHLSDNQLTHVDLEGHVLQDEGGRREEHGRGEGAEKVPNTSPLMFPKLQSLRLSNNRLQEVPSGIHRHTDVCELTLDNNKDITRLPSNLHLLQDLFFFTFEGISDPVVSELRSCRNTPEQLLYLKAREKESVTTLYVYV